MRNVRHFVAPVMLVGLLAAVGCGSGDERSADPSRGHNMTPSTMASASSGEAFARLNPAAFGEKMDDKDAVLINVHIPYEGEIEKTDAFIPFDKILDDPRLPKDKGTEILLYCRTGRMSEEAGNALHNAGYTNLSHLEGGMRAWEAAGHTLIQNPAHAS